MKKTKKDPFKDLLLDKYEQEIEDSIPEDMDFPKLTAKEKVGFTKVASKHKELKRSKRINIRINNEDLAKVRAKANKNSIPYQTLISSIVHKYAEHDINNYSQTLKKEEERCLLKILTSGLQNGEKQHTT